MLLFLLKFKKFEHPQVHHKKSRLAFTCAKSTMKTLDFGDFEQVNADRVTTTHSAHQFNIVIVNFEHVFTCSKFQVKTLRNHLFNTYHLFIVNFEHISHFCFSIYC